MMLLHILSGVSGVLKLTEKKATDLQALHDNKNKPINAIIPQLFRVFDAMLFVGVL